MNVVTAITEALARKKIERLQAQIVKLEQENAKLRGENAQLRLRAFAAERGARRAYYLRTRNVENPRVK